jgi:branched chain amino acid efflux pump
LRVSELATVLALGGTVYALRAGGLLAGSRDLALPAQVQRGLRHVPLAVLTALVVSSLSAGPADLLPARLLASGVASLVIWRTRRMWLCIVVGLAFYNLLRLA